MKWGGRNVEEIVTLAERGNVSQAIHLWRTCCWSGWIPESKVAEAIVDAAAVRGRSAETAWMLKESRKWGFPLDKSWLALSLGVQRRATLPNERCLLAARAIAALEGEVNVPPNVLVETISTQCDAGRSAAAKALKLIPENTRDIELISAEIDCLTLSGHPEKALDVFDQRINTSKPQNALKPLISALKAARRSANNVRAETVSALAEMALNGVSPEQLKEVHKNLLLELVNLHADFCKIGPLQVYLKMLSRHPNHLRRCNYQRICSVLIESESRDALKSLFDVMDRHKVSRDIFEKLQEMFPQAERPSNHLS